MPTTKRQQKEAEILEAAERIFARKGYVNTRLEDITSALAMSKASLYFYFKNKEELYLAITFRAFQVLIDAYYQTIQMLKANPGAVRVQGLAECYLNFSEEYYHYHEAMFHYMSLIRGNFKGEQSLEDLRESIYWRRINDVHHLPMDIMVSEIRSGKVDKSISNAAHAEMIYLNIWAMIAGFVKINLFGKRASQTIYRVDHDAWRENVLQQIGAMLRNQT